MNRRRLFAVIGGGKRYLLRDLFSSDVAAGSVNGTLAIPGPGTRSVNDTAGNKISITGGRAVSTGITGAGDPRLGYSEAITRQAGRTLKYIIKFTANRGYSGFATSATPTDIIYGPYEISGALTTSPPRASGYVVFTTATDYTIWVTLFASAGAALWAQGGAYTNPTLIFVTNRYSNDPLYVFPQVARAIAHQMETDNVEVRDIPSLGSRQLLATVYQASPSTGVNYVSVADAIHYISFTLPGSPSAGQKIELRYRYQDASNYWTAYVERNGGNTAWDFKVDEVLTAGTTNKVTVTGVGSPDQIAVVCHGSEHWAFTGASDQYTLRGSKVTDADLASATEVGAWFDAGTVSLLESFARTWSL